MRITQRGRLAVALMVDFALSKRYGPIPLKVMSVRHGVSLSLLESIASALRRHSLLHATRGPGGGYSLGREAAAISMADIVFAIDGPLTVRRPPSHLVDRTAQHRVASEVWESMRQTAIDFLRSESLQKLVGGHPPWTCPVTNDAARAVPQPHRPAAPRHIANSVFDLARVGARAGARLSAAR